MGKTVDMVPIASLEVSLDDVVAVGGPGVGEAEVVMPLLAELRAAGGEDYGALVIVYRRGAELGGAEAFREKVMAHLSGRKVGGVSIEDIGDAVGVMSKEFRETRDLLFERLDESLKAEFETMDDDELEWFRINVEKEYGRRGKELPND